MPAVPALLLDPLSAAVPALLLDPLSAAVGLFAGLAVGLLLRIVSGSGR